MIEVVNRQRGKKVDTETWTRFAEKALDAIGKHGSSATIAFVSDQNIRKLNQQFRNVAKATDVLSFPAGPETLAEATNLGDIAISVQTAAAQAKENGLTFEAEIAQ